MGEPQDPLFSPLALKLWGKTDRYAPDPAQSWMPLVQHLDDSAQIAGWLFTHWLAPAQQRSIAASVAGDLAAARSLVQLLAALHDIGKCSPAFQTVIERDDAFAWLLKPLRAEGLLERPVGKRRTPHGVIGATYLTRRLRRFVTEHDASTRQTRRACSQFAETAGGHHGTFPTPTQLNEADPRQTGTDDWEALRDHLFDVLLARTGAKDALLQALQAPQHPEGRLTLCGLITIADWMASNTDLFPYERVGSRSARLEAAIARLDLTPPWKPRGYTGDFTREFNRRFPHLAKYGPNDVQHLAAQAAFEMSEPGLMILEAGTGTGKTEAALIAAEILAHRFGLGGVFFALPTMASSNPMFTRLLRWITHTTDSPTTLNLVHGKAHLYEDFQQLPRYNRLAGISADCATDGRADVAAGGWCYGRRRALLATHVVGTIDQVLFAGLRARHVALRQLALSGKVIVIDEVHASDDYMREYLCVVLRWLAAYRVPVILMTATLPPRHRDQLTRAYDGGSPEDAPAPPPPEVHEYPVITTTGSQPRRYSSGTPSTSTAPGASGPREAEQRVTIDTGPKGWDALAKQLRSDLRDGGCVAVICNTVKRAQAAYDRLREEFGTDVELLHSRFCAPHRAEKERTLIAQLGSTGERPVRRIVVATQVLEQSIDLDFDLLYTDMAPMDLLLQRIGRLHRHDRDRPNHLREAHVRLLDLDPNPRPPWIPPESVGIYRTAQIYRALHTLGELPRQIVPPRDTPALIRTAFAEDAPVPDDWTEAGDIWTEAERAAELTAADQRARAEAFTLPVPREKMTFETLTELSSGDPDHPDRTAARGKVRDSEDTIEVILVERDADGALCLPSGVGDFSGARLDREGVQDVARCRAAATCTLRLPLSIARSPSEIDSMIRELERVDISHWQESYWLEGELAFVIDAEGYASLRGHRLRYTQERGLEDLGRIETAASAGSDAEPGIRDRV